MNRFWYMLSIISAPMISHTVQTPRMDMEFSMEFIVPYEHIQNISYYVVMMKDTWTSDTELHQQERSLQYHIRRQTELFKQRLSYEQGYSRIRLGSR